MATINEPNVVKHSLSLSLSLHACGIFIIILDMHACTSLHPLPTTLHKNSEI